MNRSNISPVDEYLGFQKSFLYGLQYVLTMYGGMIAPALIIGSMLKMNNSDVGLLISAGLFVAGLATIFQTIGIKSLGIGCQLPLVQGISFASVATIVAILQEAQGNLSVVYGSIIVVSILGFLIAPFFSRILNLFPPIVTGCVITTIGLSLLPVAVNWMMGGDPAQADYGSTTNIILSFITLAAVLLLNLSKTPTVRRLSVLLAIALGALVAYFFNMGDFNVNTTKTSWFELPQLFYFGKPEFQIAPIISMLFVSLVIMTETVADIIAVGKIVEVKIDSKKVANGLRADMLFSTISHIFGSFMQSAFAQNVGLLALSGIKSRFVVTMCGVILLILGLFPILGSLIASIPLPVIGGAGIILFGSIAVSGIRTLSQIDYSNQKNLVIVATALSFGLIPVVSTNFYDAFPLWFRTIFHSGISASCIFAILLNLMFNIAPDYLKKFQRK